MQSGEEVNDLLYIDRNTCTGCAVCVDTCPMGAIRMDESESVAVIDTALCSECLLCLTKCPSGAIQQLESSELAPVPAVERDILEGEVIEGKVMPVQTARSLTPAWQPGRLVALASTALGFVGNWLLPRTADALISAVERRLAQGTNSASSAASLCSENRSQMSQIGRGRGRRGRGRQRRRRGK